MKQKRIILTSLILFQMISLFGQSVAFTYDDSGNRISRTIVVQQLKSGTVELPAADAKSLKSAENAKGTETGQSIRSGESPANTKAKEQEESLKEKKLSEDSEIITLVYPNPNKGLLKIDISNMPLNSINEIRLYDLSGLELKFMRNSDSHSDVDISQFQDGIYILRIKVNYRIFDWKVIIKH